MIEVWSIILIGMALLATGATLVLFALWRADVRYRQRTPGVRGWLARTLATGSAMVLIPSWYFAATLVWRVVHDRPLPAQMLPASAVMVILALGSPVYLAARVLVARSKHGVGTGRMAGVEGSDRPAE